MSLKMYFIPIIYGVAGEAELMAELEAAHKALEEERNRRRSAESSPAEMQLKVELEGAQQALKEERGQRDELNEMVASLKHDIAEGKNDRRRELGEHIIDSGG